MKDIPMFTTEYGVASLVLREIPYQKTAYIHVRGSEEPLRLLEDCCNFCRMVGADHIFATGDSVPERFPLHTVIWQMKCFKDSLGDTDAMLFPVQEHTADEFQRIYNEKVSHIPNAAWMDASDKEDMIKAGEGYFVHRDGTLLGIGRVSGEELRFLASVQPGAGEDVARALAGAMETDEIRIEVASSNEKAVALYEHLGFIKTGERYRWYRV